jgi:hypothetical protein
VFLFDFGCHTQEAGKGTATSSSIGQSQTERKAMMAGGRDTHVSSSSSSTDSTDDSKSARKKEPVSALLTTANSLLIATKTALSPKDDAWVS